MSGSRPISSLVPSCPRARRVRSFGCLPPLRVSIGQQAAGPGPARQGERFCARLDRRARVTLARCMLPKSWLGWPRADAP
eukprot:4230074-Pyramimonas_sp.AAC.1